MDVRIEESWKQRLAGEFEKEYFVKLTEFVRAEYTRTTIYPPARLIFNAFDHCPFNEVKVVIIGQDPYHGPGQAHGLCFSVAEGVPNPPSLQNIFKEIQSDLGKPLPRTETSRAGPIRACYYSMPHLPYRLIKPLAPTPWLGGVYRCGHTHPGRGARALSIHSLGSLRTKEGCLHRSEQAPGTHFGTPLSPIGLQRVLRQQTFQPCQ